MISKSQLKYIQSLGQKKHRNDEDVFVAEGPKLVTELLQSKRAELKYLYALPQWISENERGSMSSDITEISEKELERMSQLKTPNQVIGIFKKFEIKEPITSGCVSLVLDTIQDPGNLGTIIRIADWFGISQIICSHECADLYNSKVIQATMGSIARVNVYYNALENWIQRHRHIPVYVSTLDGVDVTKMTTLREGLIVLGNESKGVRQELIDYATEKLTIPRKGQAESLNVAVATGIILSYLV